MAQHYLAKAGVAAIRRVKESDMTKLAKATSGRVVTNIEELTAKDLGQADLVEERKVEADKWVFIEGCKDPKAVTLLVKGGSQRVVDEAERALHDALMVTKDVMEKPYILVGGGAPENYVARKLRDWANSLSGREQLAVQKFADALETLPLVLAENAGMNALDTQVQLRAKNESGNKGTWGVNVLKGKVDDLSKANVYDPLAVKEQVVSSATEAASMLLRIDDVIASSKPKEPAGPAGGMGGME
jgi:chaperonin GroEL (HSP60 family)